MAASLCPGSPEALRTRLKATTQNGAMTYGQKVRRLGHRLKDPEWRRYGMLLFAGKMLGLCVLFASIFLITRRPALSARRRTPSRTSATA